MNSRVFILLGSLAAHVSFAQGFINLGFETAFLYLQPLPPGQLGGSVPVANAFRGWTAFIGTKQVAQVLHNNLTLGSPSLSIVGPSWSYGPILEGAYSAVLQASDGPEPGFDPFDVSLAQTGTLPGDANFLHVKLQSGLPASLFAVSFAGQNISLMPIGIGSNYTVYGGDISRFAGQAGELRLTAVAAPNLYAAPIYFDSIRFSSVPEPSTWALLALGTAASWCVVRRRK